MKNASLGLIVALLVIGIIINLIWLTGWGYVPLGGYLLICIVGLIRTPRP